MSRRTHRLATMALLAAVGVLTPCGAIARQGAEDWHYTGAEFAEALTGVPGSRAVVDSSGNVVAVGIPWRGGVSAAARAVPSPEMLMCGISAVPPQFGKGHGGAMSQDVYLPVDSRNHYYFVALFAGEKGTYTTVKQTWTLTGSGKKKKAKRRFRFEHGFYWASWHVFPAFKRTGIYSLTIDVTAAGSCATRVVAARFSPPLLHDD